MVVPVLLMPKVELRLLSLVHMNMKMANHDCCEKKHCKCRGFLKFVFGAGVLGLLAHMVYGYLEEDKPCPLKGWLAKHGNESTAEFEDFDD